MDFLCSLLLFFYISLNCFVEMSIGNSEVILNLGAKIETFWLEGGSISLLVYANINILLCFIVTLTIGT